VLGRPLAVLVTNSELGADDGASGSTPRASLGTGEPEFEERLETPSAAGVAGLIFSALFVASVVLLRDQPDPGSSATEIADFYLRQNHGRVVLVGLYLAPFAGFAFLWFVAALRAHLGRREDRFLGTALFGSGLLFVAMLFVSTASGGALLTAVKFLDDPPPGADTVLLARSLAFSFMFVFAVRSAAVFMLVASTIGWRTRALPRWLVIVGYAVGVLFLFSVTYVEALVLLFPAWVTAVSIVIIRASRSGLATETP
jgi:hypothetical protein